GLAANTHLMFGHRFQQRGLHLGRSPVDLVGQHQVVENGAWLEAEGTILGPEDFGAGDVAWQQVGRELDAMEVAFNRPGQILDRLGFGETWRAFHQQVTVGKKGNQQPVYKTFLADDLLGKPGLELDNDCVMTHSYSLSRLGYIL